MFCFELKKKAGIEKKTNYKRKVKKEGASSLENGFDIGRVAPRKKTYDFKRFGFNSIDQIGNHRQKYVRWRSSEFEEEDKSSQQIEIFENNARFIGENFLSNPNNKRNPNLCLYWSYYKELTHNVRDLKMKRKRACSVKPIPKLKESILTEGHSTEKPKREISAFSSFRSLRIRSLIVKYGDDMRQEVFAMHLITVCRDIFEENGLPLFIRPYHITLCGKNMGLIEFLAGTDSISALKKQHDGASLVQIFKERFGSSRYDQARINFIKSVAGYSLVCYLFQIKDRHNGNILLDEEGYVVHIDFGYFLSSYPGNILDIERAPFKLTEVQMSDCRSIST